MPESKAHQRVKRREAGKSGRTEVPSQKGKRRLDVKTPKRAKEIERSPSMDRLRQAADRLKKSRKPQKVLIVPQSNMAKAAKAMREVGVSGTIRNIKGTKRRSI